MDQAYAGQSVAYLVGPLERLDDRNRLIARLQSIASAGAHNRIGLLPDPSSRDWIFDPSCRSVVVTHGTSLDLADPGKTITDLVAAHPREAGVSLRIHVADPWLFMTFDHGLGGGRLFTEVIAAIGSTDAGFASPLPSARSKNPGLRAAGHALRTRPRRFLRSLDEPARRSRRPAVDLEPFAAPVSVVYVRSDAEYLDRARAARDQAWPGVSMSAIVASSFLRSLNALGVETEDEVSVMVDLSRHLPRGTGTLANFVGTARIACDPSHRPPDFANALREYTDGYRALTRYGLSYAARLRARAGASSVGKSDSRRARVVITDHSSSSSSEKIAWSKSVAPHLFVRQAPVGIANQITLAINRVNSELHLTASYYEAVFPESVIRRALTSVLSETGRPTP